MSDPVRAITQTIHLGDDDGQALCSSTDSPQLLTIAEWETGVDAATGSRVCRDCADEARRRRAE